MATDKQIEANRRNAQLSTGPKSPEGKAISSQNAFKHGLRSGRVLFAEPDDSVLQATRESFIAEYQPQTATEWFLVERMSVAAFKLNCFEEIEAEDETNINDHRFGGSIQLMWRHQTTLERSYHKSLDSLLKLRKSRAAEKKAAASQITAEPEPVEIAAQPEPVPAPQPTPVAEPFAQPDPPAPAEPPSQLILAPDPPDDLAPQA